MDLDHIIEYIIHHGREGFTFKKMYRACEETVRQEGDLKFEKLYLVFHVAEFAILFWIAAIFLKNLYLLAIAIGCTLHLALDQTGNPAYPFSYFVSARFAKKFSTGKLFKIKKR